jgi:hypothetical protein
MKFRKYLQEEYETSFKYGREQVPIYKNPSKKELVDIYSKERSIKFRFVIYFPKKEMYVWQAAKAIHDTGLTHIFGKEYDYDTLKWEDWLWGEADYINGKLEFTNSDEILWSRTNIEIPDIDKSAKLKFMEKWKNKDDWTSHWFGDGIINVVNKWWSEEKLKEI